MVVQSGGNQIPVKRCSRHGSDDTVRSQNKSEHPLQATHGYHLTGAQHSQWSSTLRAYFERTDRKVCKEAIANLECNGRYGEERGRQNHRSDQSNRCVAER